MWFYFRLFLLGHTTLRGTRMFVDLVAADIGEAHRRASPAEKLGAP